MKNLFSKICRNHFYHSFGGLSRTFSLYIFLSERGRDRKLHGEQNCVLKIERALVVCKRILEIGELFWLGTYPHSRAIKSDGCIFIHGLWNMRTCHTGHTSNTCGFIPRDSYVCFGYDCTVRFGLFRFWISLGEWWRGYIKEKCVCMFYARE